MTDGPQRTTGATGGEPAADSSGAAESPAPEAASDPAVERRGVAPAGSHHPHHPAREHVEASPTGRRLALLSLTALGVVYGDIGTSPLYAVKEGFAHEYGLGLTIANVYGFLSLIVWSLLLIVTVKYIGFIVRADNRGEGGVLALLALILQRRHRKHESGRRAVIIALGLFGGAFLYGDGIITPAISVLGAVEGLEVLAPALENWVVIISFAIIFLLFYFQYKGTARVGVIFGPVMLVWFVTIALLGAREIVQHPSILLAANPWFAVRFFLDQPQSAFVVLGAVVLVVTGGEALYADMGHFGKRPIRVVWFGLVLPALLINYFGQGALLLRLPEAVVNPFYLLAPRSLLIPLVILATFAAIVASQALISGAFSLTQQAVQLGYSPRVTIVHTSARQAGQIYIPEVNKALAVGTLLLVLGFQSSAALGKAYGVAVTGTMAITTVLFFVIATNRWQWPFWKAALFTGFFLLIDATFFAANLLKVPHGGWVPLVVAALVFTLMTTWKKGRTILSDILRRSTLPFDLFLDDVARRKPYRVPGTAVFMTSDPEGAPVVLLHHLKHNKVLHERVILLSILTSEVPEVPDDERMTLERFPEGFYRATARYGFMETPDVPEVLQWCSEEGVPAKPSETTYYLGRERLLPIGSSPMAGWRKKLFVVMSRNARTATEFFGIPPNRVVELGTQIEF